MPRRRASRAVHPFLALLVTVTVGIVVTIGLPSVARADPPAGWFGPFLEAVPDNGEPSDPFTANYWYVTSDACPYATVKLTWDGNAAGSTTIDQTDCSATFAYSAPPTSGIGGHRLGAIACYVDSTGTEFCDDVSIASTTYVINAPPPSLGLVPTSGLASAPFTATYNTGFVDCGGTDAQFYWDGAPVGPRVPIAVDCSAVMDFPSAPTASVGGHTVSAQECGITACFPSSVGSATYTVLAPPPPPPPSLTLTPTSGLAPQSFRATYQSGDSVCDLPIPVQFYWNGAPISPQVVMDSACSAALDIVPPAPDNGVGSHPVTARACPDGCLSGTEASATYQILAPIPTLTVAPTSAIASAPFQATYNTGSVDCSGTEVLFSWDGAPVGPRVPIAVDCSAVMDFPSAPTASVGGYTVSAQECGGRVCFPSSVGSATYTILAPPPPPPPSLTPTPTPTPTPTATPTPRPTAAPTARPTARPTPTPAEVLEPGEPSPEPVASPTPDSTPSPTGEVLEETSPPQEPPPSPAAVAVIASSPPSSGNPFVPAIVSYVGGPSDTPIDPAVVATNLLLTLLLVFLFGLTAEVFNSTMDANRDQVHGWWARLFRRPAQALGALTLTGSSLGRLGGIGRMGSIGIVLLVLSLLGLIYGFLSPDFGLNQQSIVLFVSLVVGLGFLTYFSEGSSSRLATRRYSADASIKLYGTAVIVAILAVVVSRLFSFQPGLLYGFIASAVIVAPVALARRDDATLVLVPAFGLLVVSVLAWMLLGPVRIAAADGSWAPALAETILTMIFIGGLEGLFITMLPLRFLDGATVMAWSKVAWALVFGMITFLWWQLLLNQETAYIAALEQTNVQVVLIVLAVFMVTTGGLWSYFRFKPDSTEAAA